MHFDCKYPKTKLTYETLTFLIRIIISQVYKNIHLRMNPGPSNKQNSA